MKTREFLKIMCMAGLLTAAWTSGSAATVTGTAANPTEQVTQDVVTVKGVVMDQETKQPISGAKIVYKGKLTSIKTNNQGEFEFTARSGETILVTHNPEYAPESITLTANAEDLTIELKKIVYPEYPGGRTACLKFLAKNIKYPIEAHMNGVQGRVVLQFWVETDGSIGDIKVVKSVSPDLDKEAIRVVKSMPKFKPGTIGGEIARVPFTMPIIFRLK